VQQGQTKLKAPSETPITDPGSIACLKRFDIIPTGRGAFRTKRLA
jgi:hypothetical protein